LFALNLTSDLPLTRLDELFEPFEIQWQRLAHPSRPLRMISQLVVGIGMDESRQWASVDHQPWNEGSELL
jgi:hypothetical protein